MGLRLNQKIVVFESDDWGAIRTPSMVVFEKMRHSSNGIKVNNFDRFDCLESESDLCALWEVIRSFRDSFGRHPIFTCNMVLQNPNFDAIRKSKFEEYLSETFFESYQRVWGQDLRSNWALLQQDGVIKPQFHAREHLNVDLWLEDLRVGNKATLEAFEMDCFGQMQQTSSTHHFHYLAAYHSRNPQDLAKKKIILKDGFGLFKKTFGFDSLTFIPCNYIWTDELTDCLPNLGVEGFQGSRVMRLADITANGKLLQKRRVMSYDTRSDLINTVRNVHFEPFDLNDGSSTTKALNQIASAFRWCKPAVISSHRINYVGGLDIHNRDNNLLQLKTLISSILKRWPDVRFMSSDELLLEISLNLQNS